jgi:hypothetical protein
MPEENILDQEITDEDLAKEAKGKGKGSKGEEMEALDAEQATPQDPDSAPGAVMENPWP